MQKLFRVQYTSFDGYAYGTSWCDDCPGRSNGCCKEDPDVWADKEDFLELAPSREVMLARLEGRSRPDCEFSGVQINEVPFRMWQMWERHNLRDFPTIYPPPVCYSAPVTVGQEYIIRSWEWKLYQDRKLGV